MLPLTEDLQTNKTSLSPFRELTSRLISELGITNTKGVFKIPYSSDEGEKSYSCETDIIISPFASVRSEARTIHADEIVVSPKTSSKDRMGKIFLNELLMEWFAGHSVKVVGIFLNDVQRKGREDISFAFVSGLFMVYTNFLTKLEGVYSIDRPPKTRQSPFRNHIFPFSKFIVEDIWALWS